MLLWWAFDLLKYFLLVLSVSCWDGTKRKTDYCYFFSLCLRCPLQGHLSKDCRTNRVYNGNIHSAEAQDDPSDTFSDQSSDNSSEDDWTIGCETRGTNKDRKHNKYWSKPEVLKLVEGVSKYGVGRWSDIKRMFFQSSAHRSPADLKVLDHLVTYNLLLFMFSFGVIL